jgi:polyisoprenoid-binding protein YceI
MTNPIADAKPGTTWVLDPARSTLTFRAKSFWGALPVKGTFGAVAGDGEITASRGVAGRVRIDAASLATGIGKRDEHLRSADFFDVERFPAITVEVHGATPSASDRVDLDATVTVKETARRLVLPATAELLDDGAVRVTTGAAIDRTEWGVDGNLIGMIPKTTRIEGVAVFAPRAGAAS